MNLRFLVLSFLALVAASRSAPAAAPAAAPALDYNPPPPTTDRKGALAAQGLFAQSLVIPARPGADDRQPRLVSF
ncbi:MAG: hypothetical protein ACKORI_04965, partial [Verrucomicrobiota bacterium]